MEGGERFHRAGRRQTRGRLENTEIFRKQTARRLSDIGPGLELVYMQEPIAFLCLYDVTIF